MATLGGAFASMARKKACKAAAKSPPPSASMPLTEANLAAFAEADELIGSASDINSGTVPSASEDDEVADARCSRQRVVTTIKGLPKDCSGCDQRLTPENCHETVSYRGKDVCAGPLCIPCDSAYTAGGFALNKKYDSKVKFAEEVAKDDNLKDKLRIARNVMEHPDDEKPFKPSLASASKGIGYQAFSIVNGWRPKNFDKRFPTQSSADHKHEPLVTARAQPFKGILTIPAGQPDVQYMVFHDCELTVKDTILGETEKLYEGHQRIVHDRLCNERYKTGVMQRLKCCTLMESELDAGFDDHVHKKTVVDKTNSHPGNRASASVAIDIEGGAGSDDAMDVDHEPNENDDEEPATNSSVKELSPAEQAAKRALSLSNLQGLSPMKKARGSAASSVGPTPRKANTRGAASCMSVAGKTDAGTDAGPCLTKASGITRGSWSTTVEEDIEALELSDIGEGGHYKTKMKFGRKRCGVLWGPNPNAPVDGVR